MKQSKGYVYLLFCEGYYKIGRSKNDPLKRQDQLQTGSPFYVKLVHKIETDDPVWVERMIHNRFEEKRYRGEWFALDDADVYCFRSLNGNGLTPEEQAALDEPRPSTRPSITDRLNGKSTESVADYMNRLCGVPRSENGYAH